MVEYLDELNNVLHKISLNPDEIVIVGSSAISRCGGRKNNDIEFFCMSHAYNKLPLKIRIYLFFYDHYDISKNVDIFRHRYANIGIDDMKIADYALWIRDGGYKYILPEIEIAYKLKLKRSKDLIDMKNMADTGLLDKFDNERINLFETKKLSNKNMLRLKLCGIVGWRLYKIKEMIRRKNGVRD